MTLKVACSRAIWDGGRWNPDVIVQLQYICIKDNFRRSGTLGVQPLAISFYRFSKTYFQQGLCSPLLRISYELVYYYS